MIKKFENFNKKKVIVFHGLGGEPNSERTNILRNFGYEVVYPHIDFEMEWSKDKGKSLFERTSRLAEGCDLIIGVSLGGYLASLIGNYLGIDCILINPALDRNKTRLDIKNLDCPHLSNKCNMEVFIGDKDTLIPKEYTLDYIKDNNINCKIHHIIGMEHRCSLNNFLEILNQSSLVV
jgi:hypothetical protein